MKAIRFFVTAIVLFMVFVQCGDNKVWKNVVIMNDYWRECYSLKLPDGECHLCISLNGQEIQVTAVDYNFYGRNIEQNVRINSVTHRWEGSWSTYDKKIGFSRLSTTGGYDVFYVKFLKHTQKLPPSVRAKFVDFWGIK
ncbi:MAG TPA: hypothetical protein PLK76_02585 [bacterium]|mgnify:CR=1 FL=1|nr:hypothetical protein [bacterium]